MKYSLAFLLLVGLAALTLAEPRVPRNGLIHEIPRGVAGPNPYIFLTAPRGRSQSLVQGFEVVQDEEDDDDEDSINKNVFADDDQSNDDDDDEEQNDDDDNISQELENDDDDEDDNAADNMASEEEEIPVARKANLVGKSAKAAQMMIARDQAGAIMVPDEIIEIEGQSVIDEKTGKPALLLPRSVLDSIPDGSVVALMEQPIQGRSVGEERANRVIVRRRRKGSRRNVKRRRVSNRRRRLRGGNRRRRGGNRVRVVRVNGNRRRNNRRRGNRRRVAFRG